MVRAVSDPQQSADEDDLQRQETTGSGVQVSELLAWRSGLRRYFRAAIGAQDADDYTQEVIARFLSSLRREKIENPRGFLGRVASNLLAERHRRQAVRRRSGEEAMLDDVTDIPSPVDGSPERIAAARQQLARIETMLAAMPEQWQRCFVLVRFENKTYREVGALLGISEALVWKNLNRIMVKLAEAGLDP